MDSKEYLTNKSFCPIPWTGFMYNSDGTIMNCVRSQQAIGNLNNNSVHDILSNNTQTKNNMLAQKPGQGCNGCYALEFNKKSFEIISDRVFYLRELKELDRTIYDDVENFNLHQIDIRWSNVCNFGCIYCSPEYSSRIANEYGVTIQQPNSQRVQEMKNFVFDNAHQLKHVYMAGGEPLLMKENLELLELLKKVNPTVNLRVNTNLSKVDTRVFETICEFPNVHWTVSVEDIEERYEYIRYGGSWQDFVDNLTVIQKLNHKISFNMLYFILNSYSIFECIAYLQKLGFHNNSFVLGPVATPDYLNIRHLPNSMLQLVEYKLKDWINNKPGFLLEDGLKNMLQYIKNPIEKDIDYCLTNIEAVDKRRGLNYKQVFPDFYKEVKSGN